MFSALRTVAAHYGNADRGNCTALHTAASSGDYIHESSFHRYSDDSPAHQLSLGESALHRPCQDLHTFDCQSAVAVSHRSGTQRGRHTQSRRTLELNQLNQHFARCIWRSASASRRWSPHDRNRSGVQHGSILGYRYLTKSTTKSCCLTSSSRAISLTHRKTILPRKAGRGSATATICSRLQISCCRRELAFLRT